MNSSYVQAVFKIIMTVI